MTALRLLLASLLVCVAAGAWADDVKVLAAVGYKPVLNDLAPSYEKQSGHKVHVEYDSPSAIARRVANNEFFDIVISTQDAVEKFAGRRLDSLAFVGGGANSDLWSQIHADVLQRPVVQVSDPRHAQLRGVALWARICLGELTLEEVPALVPVAQTFHPASESRAAYAHGYGEYRKLSGTLKGLYHRLNSGLS